MRTLRWKFCVHLARSSIFQLAFLVRLWFWCLGIQRACVIHETKTNLLNRCTQMNMQCVDWNAHWWGLAKWPWQDSNLQPLVPKTNALSIRPQGRVVELRFSFKLCHELPGKCWHAHARRCCRAISKMHMQNAAPLVTGRNSILPTFPQACLFA